MTFDQYPLNEQKQRINKYKRYERIFTGDHWNAFNMASVYKEEELKVIEYVVTNFGGLLSRVSADLLFEEFPKIEAGNNQEFIDAVIQGCGLKAQFYESALEGSFRGDALFRIRAKDNKLYIEDINPSNWIPNIDTTNIRKEPEAHTLAYIYQIPSIGKVRKVLHIEIHKKGFIINELYDIDDNGKVGGKLDINKYKEQLGIEETVETKTTNFLVTHVPNYRINTSYFGISDYNDIEPLAFALNNRITRVDQILNKHGDPILAVPSGVLDDEGRVARGSFGVVEIDSRESNGAKPEYIVWDAKLESAFLEIDKIVDFMFLIGDISPAILGIDKGGQAESGRALKFKLLRTIAKKHRKQLYYDTRIKDLLYTAQEFASANKLEVKGVKSKSPEPVTIEWQDGIINDAIEQLEVEERRLDNDLTSPIDSIMRIDGVSRKEAEQTHKEALESRKNKIPTFNAQPKI